MPRAPLNLSGRLSLHLVVSDMKRSIDFYVTQLGFFYDHGVDNMAWLSRDNLLLTLSPGTPQTELNSYWGWSVPSAAQLDELFERFARRGLLLSAAPDAPGGRMYFFLYDPDNYPLVFSLDTLEHPAGKI
jgi:catechol 2,3-dioxygenase-like lactoylglutathione lyase family enzyme